MASQFQQQTMAVATNVANFDEQKWLARVQNNFTKERLIQEGENAAANLLPKVFDVPNLLRATKPEAYTPQMFALGPYHLHRPELHDMERYKLAAAKRTEKCFINGKKFDHLVQQFVDHDLEIRAGYRRYLELGEATLAWLIAIDTCFVLEFLQSFLQEKEGISVVIPNENRATIIRDVMMLENQIPLFLLTKTIAWSHSSEDGADKNLSTILDSFIKEVSPIRVKFTLPDLSKQSHLLELLYNVTVPDLDGQNDPLTNADDIDFTIDMSEIEVESNKVKEAVAAVTGLFAAPMNSIKEKVITKPLAILSKLPKQLSKKIPMLAVLAPLVEKFFLQQNIESKLHDINLKETLLPLVEQIMIPSVSKLAAAGVKFVPVEEGINGIDFDANTATFHLPVVTLDSNTEVILRNLVAYEATAVKGPLVLARYTELMNGIIDTAKDVKILRESGVIVNHMKSDKDVANVWNSMSRAMRITKVKKLDRVIQDVNFHRNKKWIVKSEKFLKKYVFRSWKLLTFLSAIILLLMTGLQTFCSVYTCNRWFSALGTPAQIKG